MRLKALHQKNLVKAKKIIADSITDHLIPQVSSLETLKEMFDSLINIFEGKNINQKINLRKQLKNVKIQNVETIQSYFTMVSQIKEQLEAERRSLPMKQINKSIQLSFHDIVLLCICLYSVDVLCMIECLH